MIKKAHIITILLSIVVALTLTSCYLSPKSTPSVSKSQNSPPTEDKAKPETTTEIHIPVLYYHSILEEKGNPLRIPPEQFEEQMNYLSTNEYHAITPDDLFDALYRGKELPVKSVLITFDDGYMDNYTNAFPIMKKFGFTGTVFMVGNYIDGKGFLTGEQLKELANSGWTIGGHTHNHVNLLNADPNTIITELETSRKTLETLLERPIKYFCYPYGGYSANIIEYIKDHDYIMAFTTEKGWVKLGDDPYTLRRVYIYADMGMDNFIDRITNPDY